MKWRYIIGLNLVCLAAGLTAVHCARTSGHGAADTGSTTQVAPPPPPKCLKQRTMHVHGTYQAHYGTSGGHGWVDAPVDLYVDECLEWETPALVHPPDAGP